ncbi:MAG: basic amino acid ABC transporter substrate-binding protein [Anaerolineae bacterium]|nr:MAG: basic amino acid ABC transporter substrate-binding protein [Anaerolineae bacterium]MCL4877287.1 basic amino acid ABC transporter substrate-binding protein [Anaerolineae bacterium]
MRSKLLKLALILALILSVVTVLPTVAQEGIGTITVGTNAEYPPFESVDEDGNIIGFDIDLMNAIAEDAGFEVEFVNTKWDGIFTALSQGEFDAVISAATITEEREEIIDFSDPYFNAGQVIAVPAAMAETVSTVEDLVGLRVGVQLGTTGDEFASELEGVEVVRFDEITLAFQAMGEGELDAIVNDGPTSADIIANNPDLNAVIVGEPLTDEFYGIAVYPERTDVLDAVNVSLANLIADGTYAEIYMEWFGVEPSADFMPAEAVMIEVDPTDPGSVIVGHIATLLSAESPEEILTYVCEEPAASSIVPTTAEELAAFAGIDLQDASGLTFEVTEVEDGVVDVVPSGNLVLNIGTLPASLLLTQLGIQSIRLVQNDEGNWQICPAAAE